MSNLTVFGYPVKLVVDVDGKEVDVTEAISFDVGRTNLVINHDKILDVVEDPDGDAKKEDVTDAVKKYLDQTPTYYPPSTSDCNCAPYSICQSTVCPRRVRFT